MLTLISFVSLFIPGFEKVYIIFKKIKANIGPAKKKSSTFPIQDGKPGKRTDVILPGSKGLKTVIFSW